MTKVVATESALRDIVREAMFNKEFSGWSSNDEGPANVDPVVDPSQAVTDPINPSFKPQTKTEFGIAINQLVKNLPDTEMPTLFDMVKTTLDKKEDSEDEEEKMADQKVAGGGTGVEETVRKEVRKMLADINPRWNSEKSLEEAPGDKKFGPVVGELPPVKKIPAGEHGTEYLRRGEKHRADLKKWLKKDVPDEVEPTLPDDDAAETGEEGEEGEEGEAAAIKRAYKPTALGGMSDVSGSSFEQIAKELGFSVAGAKQAVDKALEKAQFIATGMDDDEREILTLNALNDYIKVLSKTGEMTAADVQLMKDHPDIVRELDGFREFLHKKIKSARKSDQSVEDPMGDETGEADASGETPATEPETLASKRSKDSYKVYPWRGKRSVVRVGGKLYGTAEDGKLPDGGDTQFKGGERAKVTPGDGKVTVGKTDSDHTQTWDPVEEGKKHIKLVEKALKKFGALNFPKGKAVTENTAAKVAQRKKSRPDLYCQKCLWMTGGGACPKHGGPPWTKEREAAARAKSQGDATGKAPDKICKIHYEDLDSRGYCRACEKERNMDRG